MAGHPRRHRLDHRRPGRERRRRSLRHGGEIAFDSGAVVAKDDLLVRLDTSSRRRNCAPSRTRSNWPASMPFAPAPFRANGTVSQVRLDTAEAALTQSRADADAIRAPSAGDHPHAVRRQARHPSDQRRPVSGCGNPSSRSNRSRRVCRFSCRNRNWPGSEPGCACASRTDTYPDRRFEGTLTAINPDLDASTRSVGAPATLDNPDQRLRPGMFARVEVLLPEERQR